MSSTYSPDIGIIFFNNIKQTQTIFGSEMNSIKHQLNIKQFVTFDEQENTDFSTLSVAQWLKRIRG